MSYIQSEIRRWDEVNEGETVLADLKFAGKHLITITGILPLAGNTRLLTYQTKGYDRKMTVEDAGLVAVVKRAHPEDPVAGEQLCDGRPEDIWREAREPQ